ncbi:hypothetical protein ADK64_37370 [Streptomyces sp. MMG1121]|nr:hypothetical protein ADK64_37370 [Streptomyces sp. MMG1121]
MPDGCLAGVEELGDLGDGVAGGIEPVCECCLFVVECGPPSRVMSALCCCVEAVARALTSESLFSLWRRLLATRMTLGTTRTSLGRST